MAEDQVVYGMAGENGVMNGGGGGGERGGGGGGGGEGEEVLGGKQQRSSRVQLLAKMFEQQQQLALAAVGSSSDPQPLNLEPDQEITSPLELLAAAVASNVGRNDEEESLTGNHHLLSPNSGTEQQQTMLLSLPPANLGRDREENRCSNKSNGGCFLGKDKSSSLPLHLTLHKVLASYSSDLDESCNNEDDSGSVVVSPMFSPTHSVPANMIRADEQLRQMSVDQIDAMAVPSSSATTAHNPNLCGGHLLPNKYYIRVNEEDFEDKPRTLTRSVSMDSDGLLLSSTSDDSSVTSVDFLEEEDSPTTSRANIISQISILDTDEDEVFPDSELVCTDNDEKLIDWAFNVFVPVCRNLLFACGKEVPSSKQVLASLNTVSNTINFFCNKQLKGPLFNMRGVVSSQSSHNISSMNCCETGRAVVANSMSSSQLLEGVEVGVGGVGGVGGASPRLTHQEKDSSYAVKILRSVSHELINPLLASAANGFTSELYASIVVALQKISWKVEACLSFSNPDEDCSVHYAIFDERQTQKVTEMMIQAQPPEEPKLNSISGTSRSNSVVSRKSLTTPQQQQQQQPQVPHLPLRRTSKPQAEVEKELSPALLDKLGSIGGGSREQSPAVYREVTPNRARDDASCSPTPSGKMCSSSSIGEPKGRSFEEEESNYLRPRAFRRTTISLSKREVHKLGFRMARRQQVTTGGKEEREGEREREGQGEGEGEEEVVKLLQDKLIKEFDTLKRDSVFSSETDEHLQSRSSSNDSSSSARIHKVSSSAAACVPPLAHSSSSTSSRGDADDTSARKGGKGGGGGGDREGAKPVSSLTVKGPDQQQKTSASFSELSTVSHPYKKPVKKSLSESATKSKRIDSSASASSATCELAAPTSPGLSKSLNSSGKKKKIKKNARHSMTPEMSPTISPRSYGRGGGGGEEGVVIGKSSTMTPEMKKKGTLSRLISKGRRKNKSFGSADSKGKTRQRQSSSEFVVDRGEREEDDLFNSYSLYTEDVSVTDSIQGQDQLLVSVDLSSKSPRKRSSTIISNDSSSWFDITVTTNMKQFGRRNHYTILRQYKEVKKLYDGLAASDLGIAHLLPERPTRKKQQIEEFLRCIAGSPQMRVKKPFIEFLMPDNAFAQNDSEVNFELLMTFYTPEVHSGAPGSTHAVHIVPGDQDLPDSGRNNQGTLRKKGSLQMMKKNGKEDPSTFVIREEGSDALIVAYEEDRCVVMAGTFEKLVEQMACEEKPDLRFVTTFIMGYRHFETAEKLLSVLLKRFHMSVAPDASEEEIAYAEKWRYMIQLRVLDILSFWLKKCWPDFYRNPPVLEKTRDFVGFLKRSEDSNFQLAGNNLEKIISDKVESSVQYTVTPAQPSPASQAATPTTPAPKSPSTTARRSLTLQHSPSMGAAPIGVDTLTAIQLARQLTLIELEMLRAIDLHELVVHIWEPNTPECRPFKRNLAEYISRFNKVSYWAASEICSIPDAKARGALIEKVIDIAKYCHEYKNINTTIALVLGLSLAAVRRLKKSWEYVSERSIKSFHKLSLLMLPANNHAHYRRALAGVSRREACIPYFGVFVKDLTFFNDGNLKKLHNGLLNFSKLRTIVYKFEELKRYQRSKYYFPLEDRTREYCRQLHCLSETELYDASYAAEPRERESPEVTAV